MMCEIVLQSELQCSAGTQKGTRLGFEAAMLPMNNKELQSFPSAFNTRFAYS